MNSSSWKDSLPLNAGCERTLKWIKAKGLIKHVLISLEKLFSLQNFHLMIKKDGEKCKEVVRSFKVIEYKNLYKNLGF